jgi:hypothetical protein
LSSAAYSSSSSSSSSISSKSSSSSSSSKDSSSTSSGGQEVVAQVDASLLAEFPVQTNNAYVRLYDDIVGLKIISSAIKFDVSGFDTSYSLTLKLVNKDANIISVGVYLMVIGFTGSAGYNWTLGTASWDSLKADAGGVEWNWKGDFTTNHGINNTETHVISGWGGYVQPDNTISILLTASLVTPLITHDFYSVSAGDPLLKQPRLEGIPL